MMRLEHHDRPSTLSDPTWLWADACLRDPDLFRQPRGRKLPSWLPRHAPREPRFYYRRGGRVVPLTEPGLWVPLSCAITIVTSVSSSTASVVLPVTSGQINTTGADLITFSGAYFDGTAVASDNKGNTYTSAGDATYALGYGTGHAQIWYAASATVGSGHDFTMSDVPGLIRAAAISVIAWAGATATPLDQVSAGGNNNRASTTFTTGSITPSENNELVVVGLMGEGTDAPPFTINGGFAIPTDASGISAQAFATAMAYLIQTSAAASNPTVTVATSGNLSMGIQASFKATGGGGGGNPWYYYQQN